MKIIIIFFFLSFSKCTTNKDLLYDFKKIELAVDSTISSKSLEIVDIVQIEETDLIILNQISALDIDYQSNRLIITDPVNRSLNIYNYKTGQIINSIVAGLNLSDSVIFSGRIPLDHTLSGKRFRFLKFSEYEKHGLSNNAVNMQKNRYFVPKYINSNEIEVLSIIYTAICSEDNYKVLDNTAAMITYDSSLSIQSVRVIENKLRAYSLPNAFLKNKYNGNYLITSSSYQRPDVYKYFDSLTAVSLYDENGDFIKIVSYLPAAYERIKSGYTLGWSPKMVQLKNKFFVTFPLDLSIYNINNNINNQKQFDLINLPYNNDLGFENFEKVKDKLKGLDITLEKRNEIINSLFPVSIFSLTQLHENLLIRVLVYDDKVDGGYYYILQEYGTSGELLSQTNIYEDMSNRIHYITFDNANNYLVLFKKNKEGWTMEKRKWK